MKKSSKPFFLLVLGIVLSVNIIAQSNTDPVLMTIAGEKITKSEFVNVYKKNNRNDVIDKKSLEEYLEMYINFKLKVHEAMQLGMDTASGFKNELAGYRKQLAQPYLNDEEFMNMILKEAYERSKYDIRASHILVMLKKDATPEDTLQAYKKITDLRKRIMNGEDFGDIAFEASADESAHGQKADGNRPAIPGNRGDLGYFTAMDMIYPFETAAYNTPVGQVSMPVRTEFGYHLIKVVDKKEAMGRVQVAHLHVRIPENATSQDSLLAKQKVEKYYQQIVGGAAYEDMVSQYSEDKGSAAKGGVLPWFGVNRMVPEFIVAIQTLKQKGDISKPVLTMYGWHIIKLVDQKKPGTYEEEVQNIKSRISRDSRALKSRDYSVAKIKKEFGYKEYPKALKKFYTVTDSTLLTNSWKAEKASKLSSKMFKIGETTITQKEFAAYLETNQGKFAEISPKALTDKVYSNYVDETCLDYKDKKLETLYPEFKLLMTEYHDGILLFSLTDEKVWSKAMKDSAGLEEFYQKNQSNFMWEKRVKASVFTCADYETANKVRGYLSSGLSNEQITDTLNKGEKPVVTIESNKYQKGDKDIIDGLEWTPGTTQNKEVDSKIVFVKIDEVLPVQPKKLEEARGLITAAYQDYLEKQWIKELRTKYQVNINNDVFNSIK